MTTNQKVWVASFIVGAPAIFGCFFLPDYLKRQHAISFYHARQERILAQIDTAIDSHHLAEAEHLLLAAQVIPMDDMGREQGLDDRFEAASSKLEASKQWLAKAFNDGELIVRKPISRSYAHDASEEEKAGGEYEQDSMPADEPLQGFEALCRDLLARLDRTAPVAVTYMAWPDPDNEYLSHVILARGNEVFKRFAADYVLELRTTKSSEPRYIGQLEVVGYSAKLLGRSDKKLEFSQRSFPELVDTLTKRAQERSATSIEILGQEYVDRRSLQRVQAQLRKYRFTFAIYNQEWILQDIQEERFDSDQAEWLESVDEAGRTWNPRYWLYAYVMSALDTRDTAWPDD